MTENYINIMKRYNVPKEYYKTVVKNYMESHVKGFEEYLKLYSRGKMK